MRATCIVVDREHKGLDHLVILHKPQYIFLVILLIDLYYIM